MNAINTKIHKLKYTYALGEFLPVYSAGQLVNKGEYVRYKIRCIVVKRSLA